MSVLSIFHNHSDKGVLMLSQVYNGLPGKKKKSKFFFKESFTLRLTVEQK